MKEMIKQLITGQRERSDIWHYIVGNYRHKLYYSSGAKQAHLKKHPLMRQYIWEQIQHRIKVMNPTCYYSGSCVKCGCQTTQLQMANKRCDGICYPTMMNKENWERFKLNGFAKEVDGQWMNIITMSIDKPDTTKSVFYKETPDSHVPNENI